MKLSASAARRYFAAPDPALAGLLIYGPDPMRIAERRAQACAALTGPGAEEEMRLTRIAAAELRKDTALLSDSIRAQGFFPGPRVVLVEQAGDGLTATLKAALADWRAGDAAIVVTAGQLAARSALRKLFEGHVRACAAPVYADPPGRDEVATLLKAAGLSNVPRQATEALMALSRSLDPGDFRQTLEKLALYKLADATPVNDADIAAVAPLSTEAGLDDLLNTVAEARVHEIGPLLRRIASQGVNPTTLCIAATRHFRALHTVVSDPGGPASGIGRLRPPPFGPRRERMLRQTRIWDTHLLEVALRTLFETDLALRTSRPIPGMALVERSLIRLAMLGRRQQSR